MHTLSVHVPLFWQVVLPHLFLQLVYINEQETRAINNTLTKNWRNEFTMKKLSLYEWVKLTDMVWFLQPNYYSLTNSWIIVYYSAGSH